MITSIKPTTNATFSIYGQTCPTYLGNGVVKLIGEKAAELKMKKVMLVTDQGIVNAGIAAKVEGLLKASNIEVYIFDQIMPDPLDTIVNEGGKLVTQERIDGIIGLGGGSCMDAAKGISILATNKGPINDYFSTWDYNAALPIILIPTTMGTGSENTKFAVITDSSTHTKKIVWKIGDIAICDPELTYASPKHLIAATGLDALAHAAEAMTVKEYNPMTEVLGVEAIKRITKYLPTAHENSTNVEAMYNMMFASNLAGLALTNSGCNIGHACAEVIGAAFNVPHGICCAWGLPETLAHAAKDRFQQVQLIADVLNVEYSEHDSPETLGEKVADNIRLFIKELNILPMSAYQIEREQLMDLADVVMTNHAFFNLPNPLSKEEVKIFLGRMYDTY